MKIRDRLNFDLRTMIMAVSAGILVWLVITRSVAAYLAGVSPVTALWLNAQQPQALVNLADQAFNAPASVNAPQGLTGQTPAAAKAGADAGNDQATFPSNFNQSFDVLGQHQAVDLSAVHAWAETALMNDPLNARALRLLGQIADAARDDKDAVEFMRAATRESLHESIAAYWLMRRSVAAKDYGATLYYGDVLLRTQPQFESYVLPVLAQLAVNKDSSGLLETALSTNPPWRRDFLGNLPDDVPDARIPLNVLLALRTNARPPTTAEIEPYIQDLIAHKFYDLAYYAWLQFLAPADLRHAGLLFNGSFEGVPSGLPFDWQMKSGSGVTIDIVTRSDKTDEHALLVDFQYGRVDYHSVTELVMLSPGTYQFTGQYNGELIGPRGLKWRIMCAGETPNKVGESLMISGMTRGWKDVAFNFTVPANDCRAQIVKLDLDARTASEQLISGSMLFDGLAISRVQTPPS
jgi:hypothetical protein